MMSEPIIFYDIPGKDTVPNAWSPNTWKARFVLNIKGIPYKTVWVEYPDIAPLLRKISALPTGNSADGSPLYTLPAIYDPNTKTAVAESALIARYLDKAYPDTPRLIPAETDALHAAFDHAFLALGAADLGSILVPEVATHLRPPSEAYFRAAREADFGVPLQELTPPGPKREKHWAGVERLFGTFAEWLQADGVDKPFFLGDRIGYADVIVVSFLVSIRILFGESSKEWTDVKAWNQGCWARLVDAFKQYEVVDSGEVATLDS